MLGSDADVYAYCIMLGIIFAFICTVVTGVRKLYELIKGPPKK